MRHGQRPSLEEEDDARPVGFERLAEAGFTPQEVAELRQQFQLVHGANASPQEEERWLMEAPRMERQQQQQQQQQQPGRTAIYDEVFFGALVGFLFPPAAFWSRLFKRGRFGVMIGACANVAFHMMRILFT